jgi:hypothetical protein
MSSTVPIMKVNYTAALTSANNSECELNEEKTYNPDVVNTTKHGSSQLGPEGVPHPVLNLGLVLVLHKNSK